MSFIRSLRVDALLSFRPGSDPIPLTALNVLIGPNGAGKSNLIEALELLHAAPTGFSSAIRDGGGAAEWLWKGRSGGWKNEATIEATIQGARAPLPGCAVRSLRYRLAFRANGSRTEVSDEAIERAQAKPGQKDVFFYYRFQGGRPAINVRQSKGEPWTERHLERQTLAPDESVLSQRKDPDLYPELTWLGQQFARIQTFREWSFGRYAALRQPQPADLPTDTLLPDSRNLALVLNGLEHSDAGPALNRALSTLLPRFKRISTRIDGNTVQFHLHEEGLRAPVPATRLSDGTIRFIALLALLLLPSPPPLICIEEPERGLHPDALTLLAELMLTASTRTQLIVSTHSDTLVSAFAAAGESVLVCEYQDGTVVRRLESPRLRAWLEKYRLGDIWRLRTLGATAMSTVS